MENKIDGVTNLACDIMKASNLPIELAGAIATDHLECLWEDPADFLNHRTFIKCPNCNQYVEINEVTENE